MSSRDGNSHDRNPSQDTGETAELPGSQRYGRQTETPEIRWIQGKWNQGERRLPENAQIRRWMDLGDKALQDDDEEFPIP